MKISLVVLGVLGIMSSAFAAGINYSESWESPYVAGSAFRFDAPFSDAANWPTTLGHNERQVIQNSSTSASSPLPPTTTVTGGVNAGTNILQMDAGGNYGNPGENRLFGITHDFGGVYAATAANPIVITWYQQTNTAGERKYTDFFLELALDDVSGGTLASPQSHNAIAAAQSKTVRGGTADSKGQYYDGNAWRVTGAATNTWRQFKMTVTGTQVSVKWGDAGTYTADRGYMGNFDQINIRHPYVGTTGSAWMDLLSVSGGELVPEPATLTFLVLGLPLLLRRKK